MSGRIRRRRETGLTLIGALVALLLIGGVLLFMTGLSAQLHRADREKRAGSHLEGVAEMVLERYVREMYSDAPPPTPQATTYALTLEGLREEGAESGGTWLDTVETLVWREPIGSGHRVWVVARSPRSRRGVTLVRYTVR